MKIHKSILFIFCSLVLCHCASVKLNPVSLNPVSISINEPIGEYKYIYITPTSTLASAVGGIYGNQYGVYGTTQNKTVIPSDIIAGKLLRGGYTRLPQISPELLDKTLIINYGESGRRETGHGGYTIEVTIQFLSAKNNAIVCSCTGEGQGATEADDIRIAINRCLDEFLKNKY